MEQVKLFLEKLNTDETLQGKMKELAADTAKANIADIIALAKENGFDFSKEDMDAFAQSLSTNGELTDEQLEQVAGGDTSGVPMSSGMPLLCGPRPLDLADVFASGNYTPIVVPTP